MTIDRQGLKDKNVDEEDVADVLELAKTRKKAREKKEEKERREKERREKERKAKEKEKERRKKRNEEERRRKEELKKQGKKEKVQSSPSIAPTEFERVARKAQKKKEKVVSGLLKMKVIVQGAKALTQEKKEVKLREQEELLNKIDKVPLFAKKRKVKNTLSEELVEEFKRELDNLSPLEEKS
ncbi:protein MNN4-like [Cucumis melo var. makuwa]|uniref:Protein MNN4-like n=2 Tax=Cucumis melo TaxID=3656 RepID=A0A5D3BNL6_CUCMM|nr:protein MNN4-like [Cucumis melo var. makuwa]